jgi:hypothetical protein
LEFADVSYLGDKHEGKRNLGLIDSFDLRVGQETVKIGVFLLELGFINFEFV